MSRKLISPEHILPSRMMMKVPENTHLRFSILGFPYAKALETFLTVLKRIYRQNHEKEMPYSLLPPDRQLNNAIIALAPSLIQAFETKGKTKRMVAFTRYDENGEAEDYPSLEQLRSLIQHWLLCWSEQKEIQKLLLNDAKRAWEELQEALNGDPETEWRHHIKPSQLLDDPSYEDELAYIALPALVTTLLENKTIHLYSEQREYPITWRRVNAGGKHGFYLVSQPILYKDDYFAYRLDFSLQTQTGYTDHKNNLIPWIFANLSIRRYIGDEYIGDDKRNTSVLVGFNREYFETPWNENTTTLVELDVRNNKWDHGLAQLLDRYMITPLVPPQNLFDKSLSYGNYDNRKDFRQNEYYIVYAEGRKFGEETRPHQVNTGTSLRERSQVIAGVLSLLEDWLEISPAYERDMQNPANTFALRDFNYMVKKRKDKTKYESSWQHMLRTSLSASGNDGLHIVILYRNDEFSIWAEEQIKAVLLNTGDIPAPVNCIKIPPSLYMPLDSGDLDPQIMLKFSHERPAGYADKWDKQMGLSYPKKRDEWQAFLNDIAWQPNARRMVLIESTGEKGTKGNGVPKSQKIKGAIRDACNREGILSQFIVGDLKVYQTGKKEGNLFESAAGRLKSAVLDLILRQQAILYAPPHEIYSATRLPAHLAHELDVIAFCRINRTGLSKFNYVLAVRLRADGTVHVMLPSQIGIWMPYDLAKWEVGKLIAHKKNTLYSRGQSPLQISQADMRIFAHDVLVKHLERPTIAVIEADGWRNGAGKDLDKHCWTQLRNADLTKDTQSLSFDSYHRYERSDPKLNNLLCVIRLRAGKETPQYITSGTWTEESPLRDIPHLTSYIDPCVNEPLHFLSVAQLSDTQKKQKEKPVVELFKGDIRDKYKEIPFKHPQIIELVPFFVHQDYQHDEGQRQLCRCVHLLRNSPGFVMGAINQPYPMHLGEALIEDQLCIIHADA
jgi:hypothetical protein